MSEETPNTEVVEKPKGEVGQAYDYGNMSGVGTDDIGAQDVAIPFLGIVQDGSPQRKSGKDKYIDGAVVGDLFNSVTNELLPNPLTIVPVVREQLYVEWKPRDQGGGFVAVHAVDSEVIRNAKAKHPGSRTPLSEAGNNLAETFQLYCLIVDAETMQPVTPIVISFNSTKIKYYKKFMTAVRTYRPPAGQKRPPLFAHLVKLTTFDDSNAKGDFSSPTLEFANGSLENSLLDPSEYGPLLKECHDFALSVQGGNVKVDHNSNTEAGSDAGEETPF